MQEWKYSEELMSIDAANVTEKHTVAVIALTVEHIWEEKMKTKTVYIAGPVTNDPDYKWKFARAQVRLERKGYEVINPVNLAAALPSTFTWKQIMEVCLAALSQADEAYFLDGWEESNGATLEFMSIKGKLPIRYEKPKPRPDHIKIEIPDFLKNYGKDK